MSKAIFISNAESIYDDLPEERYHFPQQYLSRVKETIGDFIIYYESRRKSGRQTYYATAQVIDVVPDPKKSDHYYAKISNYLPFESLVPFKENDIYYETSLINEKGKVSGGRAISAVRLISEEEYQSIFHRAFSHVLLPEKNLRIPVSAPVGLSDNRQEIFERPIVQTILNRPFRDQAFAEAVKNAYDKTCAMTGLQIINGGGRAEVQAAHIRPVAAQGPDSVRNGVALCGTVHWMFDRGLISIDNNYNILKAKNGIPEAMDRMLVPKGRLILPERHELRPHSHFLDFHREHVFKG